MASRNTTKIIKRKPRAKKKVEPEETGPDTVNYCNFKIMLPDDVDHVKLSLEIMEKIQHVLMPFKIENSDFNVFSHYSMETEHIKIV